MINVLIGISGSGKSTYTQNKLHVSSDEIRKELYTETDQTHNAEVFRTYHARIASAVAQDEDIWCDATNLTIKDRRHYFTYGVEVNAYVFLISPQLACQRDYCRHRSVGADVIYKQIKRFQVPTYDEGFTNIHFIYNDYPRMPFDINTYAKQIAGFAQTGRYHTEDLLEHSSMAYSLFCNKYNQKHLRQAAFIHDIGKLYTRTKNSTGYHFYNHAQVGTYMFLAMYQHDLSHDELLDVALLINFHDETLHPGFEKRFSFLSDGHMQLLLNFSECDRLACRSESEE